MTPSETAPAVAPKKLSDLLRAAHLLHEEDELLHILFATRNLHLDDLKNTMSNVDHDRNRTGRLRLPMVSGHNQQRNRRFVQSILSGDLHRGGAAVGGAADLLADRVEPVERGGGAGVGLGIRGAEAELVSGERGVMFSFLLFFLILAGVFVICFFKYVMIEYGSGGDGWNCWLVLKIAAFAAFSSLLSLYSVAALTVFFIYCKASRHELQFEIDVPNGKLGDDYVSLPYDVIV
ncbi:hypothetical protein SASPL_107801 [Salvia splendens]|uniref:Uncharacterized protein n=1 Tax=Salvia splendens TaxID=180675 RepID=A0A8X9A620_SALSN|nr:hypothetical protein SASPL_107801 [Salvia splendens]